MNNRNNGSGTNRALLAEKRQFFNMGCISQEMETIGINAKVKVTFGPQPDLFREVTSAFLVRVFSIRARIEDGWSTCTGEQGL